MKLVFMQVPLPHLRQFDSLTACVSEAYIYNKAAPYLEAFTEALRNLTWGHNEGSNILELAAPGTTVDDFNLALPDTWVAEITVSGKKVFVFMEDELPLFKKLSSNDDNRLPIFDDVSFMGMSCQALSHFIYNKSEQSEVLVDIQGCPRQFFPRLQLTSVSIPATISDILFSTVAQPEQGSVHVPGNRRRMGIENWAKFHVCNPVCEALGLPAPSNPPLVRVPIVNMFRDFVFVFISEPSTSIIVYAHLAKLIGDHGGTVLELRHQNPPSSMTHWISAETGYHNYRGLKKDVIHASFVYESITRGQLQLTPGNGPLAVDSRFLVYRGPVVIS
jgi:hypothetical protein